MVKDIRQQNAERRLRHCSWHRPEPYFRIKLGALIVAGALGTLYMANFC